jgi:hypothetical protein
MTQQIINLGAAPNDGTGDTLRAGGTKINDNFTELYGSLGGDPNYATSVTAEIAAAIAAALGQGPETFVICLGDEVTAITAGVNKFTFFAPFAGTIEDVFTSLTAQSSSGVVTCDLNKNGISVFSTNPSIDASEDTSLTGTNAVIGTPSFAKGDKFTVDIDAAGTTAKGLKMYVNVTRA